MATAVRSTSAAGLAWITVRGSTLHSPFKAITRRVSGVVTRPIAKSVQPTTASDWAKVVSEA